MLQTNLNKVGAMLSLDGDFGSGKEAGRFTQDFLGQQSNGTVEDRLWNWLENQLDPFPQLATDGVAFIVKEEASGLACYHAVSRWPHFLGLASGITIGVSDELTFKSEENFRELWSDHLSQQILDELAKDIGKSGSKTGKGTITIERRGSLQIRLAGIH